MAYVDVKIPIIDISDLWNIEKPDESHRVIVSIAEACRDYGFFYVKNHGVDNELQENVSKVWQNFVALPQSQKEKVMSERGGNFRGYFKFLSETTAYLNDSEPDWREGFYASVDVPDDHPSRKRFPSVTQNNKWPEEPEDFKNIVETYFNTMKKLSFKIMGSLAAGLGLKKDFFDPVFSPYPMATLGMFHYLPHSKDVGPDEFSLGEHTDYGMLAILLQDEVGGLEIYDESGQWIPAPPIPGTFLINLGDMLEVWSNGAYKATRHRVRKSQSGRNRIAMAFFFDPCADSIINPLPLQKSLVTFKDRKPNADIKIPVTFGEFLTDKYQGTFKENIGN